MVDFNAIAYGYLQELASGQADVVVGLLLFKKFNLVIITV